MIDRVRVDRPLSIASFRCQKSHVLVGESVIKPIPQLTKSGHPDRPTPAASSYNWNITNHAGKER